MNALTRLTLGVPEFLVMGLAIWWVIYSLHARHYSQLTDVGGHREFWELVEAQGKKLLYRSFTQARRRVFSEIRRCEGVRHEDT